MKPGKIIAFCLTTTAILISLARCVNKKVPDPRGDAYAGSAVCQSCHPALSMSFAHTAHFLSTRTATATSIHGLFTSPSATITLDHNRRLSMDENQQGFFQTLYQDGNPVEKSRLDLVMGGVKGETYLSREKDGYVELPASWITGIGKWTLSPGFATWDVNFRRPASRQCFECHSAWMPELSSITPGTDPSTVAVLNIDCERCHGPAAAHAAFHRDNPDVRQATAIVRISQLNRRQKMDLCATCHSGTKQTRLKTTFGFRPGDSLSAFLIPDFTGTLPPDVHGNQTQALMASKCYGNPLLNCNSCHDTHGVARGNPAGFNARCQSCHSPATHKEVQSMNGVAIAYLQQHCTDCHMPAEASASIRFQQSVDSPVIAARIVNHRIAIYADATASILKHYHR